MRKDERMIETLNGACRVVLLSLIPMVGLATDLSDLPEGRWFEIPGTALRSVAPQPAPGGNVAKITAWSGGSYDSKRRRLLVWGGGHSDYGGNEVYAFSLDSLKWSRLTEPSMPDSERTPLYPDGEPRARHTYDYVEYVPSLDRVISFGGSGPYPRGGGEFTRDLAEFSPSDNRWTFGRRAPVPPGGSIIGAHARHDPRTGTVYFIGSQRASLKRYDPNSDRWEELAPRSYVRVHSTAALDPDRRQLIVIGTGIEGSRQAQMWHLDRRGELPVDLTRITGGATEIESAYGPGLDYHPPSGKYVAWAGGGTVYVLDPDTWVWNRLESPDPSTSPGPQNRTGTYGRFRYVPEIDAFLLVNGVDQNVFLYRLPRDYSSAAASVNIWTDPAIVPPGASANVIWRATEGMAGCVASGEWSGDRAPAGEERIGPVIDESRYELSCVTSDGRRMSAEAVVRAWSASPAVTLRVTPSVVPLGQTARLTWSAEGASVCNASGAWHGPLDTRGSLPTPRVFADGRYTIECIGAGGSTERSVAVSVRKPVDPDPVGAPGGHEAPGGGLGHIDLVSIAGLVVMLAGLGGRRS